ncbi:MAG: hypothetical protein GX629_11300 [Phycisphaerae bacterium]|nr:hypothetical protein [Phycisphaerae bacterium]
MKRLGWFLIVLCVLVSGGCFPPAIIDLPDLIPWYPDDGSDESKEIETYDGKVYLIGTLTGDLKDEFEAAMTFSDYVADATDGAIVVSSDAFGELTQEQLDGLSTAFAAHQPIILVHATAEQIVAFGQQFIGETFRYTLPNGMEYAEVYAVDLEEGGHIWQWSLYPPDLRDDEDSDEEQQARLGDLIDWMQENSERMANGSVENAKFSAELAANSNELTQLASAFVDQKNFSRYGNRYQVALFIYSCHSYDTGEDWFYVQQQCVFYGGGAYGEKKVEYNQEGKGWYIDNIEIDSTMNGYDYDTLQVGMIQSSPETANNVESVTSGVSFTIGGEVGIDKGGPSAKITGGVTISNSRTVNIQDCQVINKSIDRGNNAHWNYKFKRCDSISYALYAGLTDPPDLATNTFQPMNQWIWRAKPALRANDTPIHVKLNVDLCWTWGIIDFWWMTHPDHQTTDGGLWEYNVHIPYPPIN